ncbi:MAG: glutamate--cysteine ligase, partial [Deltaproteobacteria bacterium]|nr:glutamate--cysteine ligase [Nannocystaceae bacterium]
MIVDRDTLAVSPCCDELLHELAGEQVNEVEAGPLRFSNELALHVVEMKTNGPVPKLDGLAEAFAAGVATLSAKLAERGAMLMPTAMHPTMDPAEGKLWPHDGKPIYATYDRVFGTSGHGWVNLQSTHVNLPFRGDEEFGRLHAAIRAVLPLLPGLAASSPVVEGVLADALDQRLRVYLGNQRRIPSIIGQVVPEPVWTEAAYRREILAPMYRDIAPFDPHGELQDEWLNSRGAIARFDRSAIEIRLLDIQEHPAADVAITWLVSQLLRELCQESFVPMVELQALATAPLAAILVQAIDEADDAVVGHASLLRALGLPEVPIRLTELWSAVLTRAWERRTPP